MHNMKIKIIENEQPSTPRETAQLDYLLKPGNGYTNEDVIKAFENKDNYGKFIINTRNKKEVEAAIIKHFGPNLPTHKRPLEKAQGFPFPPKTRQAMEDLINGFEGKPNLVTYEIIDDGILFPTAKNNSQITTEKIIRQVLGTAQIPYKLEKYENIKEYSLKKLMK